MIAVKNILLLVLTSFIFSACFIQKKSKNSMSSTKDNPLMIFCTCENRNGFTIEEYGKQEMKRQSKTFGEFKDTFAPWPNGWVMNEFVLNEVYTQSIKSRVNKLELEQHFNSKKAIEQAIKEMEEEYPICSQVAPQIMPLILR